MKRTILGGLSLAAVLMTSVVVEARGRSGRTVVRQTRRIVPTRRVEATRTRLPVRPIVDGNRPIVKRPIVKRPIGKLPITKRPVVGGKSHILPIRPKPFVRPHGWAKKFHKHYHLKYGKKFWYGFCYHGRHHRHWSKCVFLKRYGCYGYYCSFTSCYYYWCEPHGCYYPVSYCPTGWYVY